MITKANLLTRQVLESRTISLRLTSDHVRSVSTCPVFYCLPADALNPSKLSFLSVYFLARPDRVRQPWLLENEIRESQYCPDSARLGRVHNNRGFRIGLKRLTGAEWLRTDYTPQKGRKGLFVGNLFTLCQVLDTDKNSFRDSKKKKREKRRVETRIIKNFETS